MASQSTQPSQTPRNSLSQLSQYRVTKFQELQRQNVELLEKNTYYESLCLQLRKDLDELKRNNTRPVELNIQDISEMQTQSPSETPVPPTRSEEYITDEEELNAEIGHFDPLNKSQWIKVTSNKRNRESPNTNHARQKIHKPSPYWLSKADAAPNRFAPLQIQDDTQNAPNNERLPKPPPIFVDNVSNIKPLILLLKEIAKDQFDLKSLKNQQVKIMPKTSDIYRKIVEELGKKNTEFFTYKLKEERSFRVILRNMHPSVDIEELKKEMSELGHEVVNIWNIRKRVTKEPLPLFEVDLKLNSNNHEIYSIKSLMYCRISFEPPRPKKSIPQCTNCQHYGHTKSFCKRKPKCIKCAGNHLSKNCERKNWEAQVKCALCNGNHPANYKGCSIYKQIHESQYPSHPRATTNPSTQINANVNANDMVNSNPKLSNPLRSHSQTPGNKTRNNSQLPIPENARVNITFANALRGSSQNDENIPHNMPTNFESQNNPVTLNSSAAVEMLNALKGLMQQMQQMTTLLMSIMSKFVQN